MRVPIPDALVARHWGWHPAGRAAPALVDIDLAIAPGERVLLLGASGSGKSTLLQAWAGVLGGADEGDQTGSLTVGGCSPSEARGQIGLLLQDPDAQLVLARAHHDVAFGPENLGVPVDEIVRRVPLALDAVGLDLGADAESTRLSGGQKQRLALAGALAMQPAVLLLDEPTAQLDPQGVVDVAEAVAALIADRSITLVVVEHRVDVWAPLVDRVIVLDEGSVVADGPVADVLREQASWLADRGVWVPAVPPRHPEPPINAPAAVLLRARGLDVRPEGGALIGLGLDLDVRAGEVIALTGPNGAGKSTLLQTLAGLLPAAAGAVETSDGGHPSQWSSVELVQRFGVVFQNPEHQFVAATVRDELAVGPRAVAHRRRGVGEPRVDRRLDRLLDPLLDRLRLRRLAAASPFTLSGGEQRRLSVATALATAPPVLLLDEPSFGQDSRTWAELAALLAAHRDGGGAVVMATHDRELVAALHAREIALPASPASPASPSTSGVLVADASARQPVVERLNPVAAIAASLLPALVLVTTIDVVSAAVALSLQLALIPLLGVPARVLVRRTAPVWIAAPFMALTILLYGQSSGQVYAEFLLVRISDGSIELAIATALRVLAIGIPAIALFARPDATRLGDALGQNLRLPARFVLGGVAALRLLTLLRDDARLLERARRARGIGDRGRVRRALGVVFALLVLAIRRGSALAIGMEARGFGAPGPRTWTRPSPWRASDTAVVIIAISVSVVAVATAVLVGSVNSVLT